MVHFLSGSLTVAHTTSSCMWQHTGQYCNKKFLLLLHSQDQCHMHSCLRCEWATGNTLHVLGTLRTLAVYITLIPPGHCRRKQQLPDRPSCAPVKTTTEHSLWTQCLLLRLSSRLSNVLINASDKTGANFDPGAECSDLGELVQGEILARVGVLGRHPAMLLVQQEDIAMRPFGRALHSP